MIRKLLDSFFVWRILHFPRWYDWRRRRSTRKQIIGKFGRLPTEGDLIEDCRVRLVRIKEVDKDDPDTITLEDGASCSLLHCCNWP